ncbi:ribonuclease HII, partial [Candidatus Micrarchaeota archaeon]|nr:ribonuclease HII [Candidatus Micrarchaeota archaeon]
MLETAAKQRKKRPPAQERVKLEVIEIAFVIGVDEAGRGPVLGPMVICAYSIEEAKENELKKIGARDSKELTPAKREELFKKLIQMGKFVAVQISAEELTALMNKKISLNEIEAIKIASALTELTSKLEGVEKVVVDSPDPIAQHFEKRIRKYFDHHAPIHCEHFADKTHPVVSAASIVAKVIRDAEIEKIKKEFGVDLGIVYTDSPESIEFIIKNLKNPARQKYLRHMWETMKRLKFELMD